ncbi:MAG: choice-of-anchor Q domain-containing protein, partial [Bacteroidales bacterium]
MRKFIILIFVMIALQGLSVNVTVPANTNYLVGTSSPYNTLTPGDTLFFTNGHYDWIYLMNFNMGTLAQPIVVIPKGGEVIINTTHYFGFKVGGCTHLHITGGFPNYQMTGNFAVDTAHCGFQIRAVTAGAGMSEDDLSEYIETDHVYIAYTEIQGLFAKTDPDCTGYGQRQNFTQHNTWIHDDVFDHTGNEGMYVGSSFYTGEPTQCNGVTIYPADLWNCQIYRNMSWYSGYDGIQVACARKGSSIHDNKVFYAGQLDVPSQCTGYIIGGGDSCDVYNNYAYKCKEDSYDVMLSAGNFYDNEAWYSGWTGTQSSSDGIFEKDVATVPGTSINFYNNLIVGAKTVGLNFQSTVSANDLIENNVILDPTSGVYIQTATNNTIQRNNYENMTIANAKFADTLGTPQSTSPLVDAGYAVSYITTDFFGNPRVSGRSIDIGPVEYQYPSGDTVPSVTTASITNITQTTATGGGNVTSNGGASVTARGVCWSMTTNPTTSNSKTTDGTGTGAFTSNLTGLTGNTLYYVRAYATNSVGTAYGNQVSFTTLACTLPTVTTTPVSNITQGTATSGGNVTSDGGASVTARGVCWSTTTNPTISNSKTSDGTGTGTYTSNITGLTANTLYYVRAYATNSAGTAYGNQVSFTTLPYALPTVTTATITNIAQTTATGGGTVTSDGGTTVTARGVCWSTSTNPTTSNNFTTNGSGIGTFTSSLTGLTAGTLYYVRAYATNVSGTAYG